MDNSLEMVPVTEKISNKFKNIGIFCALLVCTIHLRPKVPTGNMVWWFKMFLEDGICMAAVPFFFMTSGFFLAAHFNAGGDWGIRRDGYWGEVRKRVSSLLVPYAIWLVAFWLLRIVIEATMHRGDANWAEVLPKAPSAILCNIGIWPFDCPFLSPLWYVRGLFILVMVSPLLYYALKKWGAAFLLFLFVVYALVCPWNTFYPKGWGQLQYLTRCGIFPVQGFFYFSFGMAWRLGLLNKVKIRLNAWLSLVIALCFIFLYAILKYHHVWQSCYVGMLGIPFTLYSMWNLFPTQKWPAWLTGAAFPIFLVHKLILPFLKKVVSPTQSPVHYLCAIAVLFVLSLLLTNAMKKWLPKISAIAFGGR